MKVLVTGAAGFVGSHVVDLLLREGHEVWCVDNLSTGLRSNLPKKVEFAKVNIVSWFDLVSEFVDFEPEAVIHLAAQASIAGSIENPIRDGSTNVMGTLNVIRVCQKMEVQRLIFASTSAVYDETETESPLVEEWPCIPKSPYGISKLAAESYVRNLMPENSVVLRFGNVYGPRQVPLGENQLIARMIRHFEKGDPFFIFDDGEQRRDFVFVEDVARACLLGLTGAPGTYNISSGMAYSVNEIAGLMELLYEVPGYSWQYLKKNDPRRRVHLNVLAAHIGLGWEPTTDLKAGILKTIDWWKKK